MKSIAIQLFILACSFVTLALHIRSGSIPQMLANACPSAQEVSSSTITFDGNEVVRQVFTCPNGNFTTPAISATGEMPSSTFNAHSLVKERSAAECTTTPSECVCGASVICGCYSESAGPVASDCSTLISSTAVISSIQGPMFIIQPMTVHSVSLRTCSLSLINLGTTPVEYCWDDISSVANGEMSCMSSPPFSDAVCMAATQRFEIHLGATV